MTDYLFKVKDAIVTTDPDGSVVVAAPEPPATTVQVVALIPVGGSSARAVPGAQVGDIVAYITQYIGTTGNGGPGTDLSSFYETTISVDGHIAVTTPLTAMSDPWALVVLTRST